MGFHDQAGLEYFQFDQFDSTRITHGIFTRKGGVSPFPWTTLNLGGTVGDERANVIENRKRLFTVMERDVNSIFDVWQVHSADVILTNSPRPLNDPHQKGDAIVTNNPNITLVMRFADCVPILLHDPVKGVIGLVHAGWQGTVKKVVQRAVEKMVDQYDCLPEDIFAGIGPSIGPDHYQIGTDVASQITAVFGDLSGDLLLPTNGSIHLNLWKANGILLEQSGIHHIEMAEICTACDLDRWYSHRAEIGKTGRFGALIGLRG